MVDRRIAKTLKRFELSFIGREMSKYNDIFLKENILELVKTDYVQS